MKQVLFCWADEVAYELDAGNGLTTIVRDEVIKITIRAITPLATITRFRAVGIYLPFSGSVKLSAAQAKFFCVKSRLIRGSVRSSNDFPRCVAGGDRTVSELRSSLVSASLR